MHFEGRAELWYQSYCIDKPSPLWDEFLVDLFNQFEPKKYEGTIGEFKLLKQEGTMSITTVLKS